MLAWWEVQKQTELRSIAIAEDDLIGALAGADLEDRLAEMRAGEHERQHAHE